MTQFTEPKTHFTDVEKCYSADGFNPSGLSVSESLSSLSFRFEAKKPRTSEMIDSNIEYFKSYQFIIRAEFFL